MPESNPENCPKPKQGPKPGQVDKENSETLKAKNKPRSAEKAPAKSERLLKFEERLKDTTWHVSNVDTAPSLRPATPSETARYRDLSDKAAAAKGIIRTYDEKGVLQKTEVVDTSDHKVGLELGEAEFVKTLPVEVKQYMRSLGLSGPYISINNILVADDGSADLSKIRLRATDTDYGIGSYTADLEKTCQLILKKEGGLTPKALASMEKTD